MSKQVTLIGMGCGVWNGVTLEGVEALERADAVLGAARLLESLPESVTGKRVAEVRPGELARMLRENAWENPCVLFSGDTGFYSGARPLIPLLDAAHIGWRVIPGVSSVQLLSARLGRPWQDWALYSAHGADCDAVAAVSQGKAAFFLCGTRSPSALCGQLSAAGLGNLSVTVGENLGYPNERITRATAREASEMTFAPLSVLLSDAVPKPYPERVPGLPDAAFICGSVPMTKQEVRAAILAKLAVCPGETLWDVGAGTGSVSIELSRAAYRGRVYAVERGAEACDLIRRNRETFGAWNLTLIPGHAPEALEALPVPDAAFIGGSGGELARIIDAAFTKNPRVRVCVSAVTLETLSAAVSALTARGRSAEVCQICVSRTRAAGKYHLFTAQNPVFLITSDGGRNDAPDGGEITRRTLDSGRNDAPDSGEPSRRTTEGGDGA